MNDEILKIQERYKNNVKFSKNIFQTKIFFELDEAEELVLKLIYVFENISRSDIKNLLFFYANGQTIDKCANKLENLGYLHTKRTGTGLLCACSSKAIKLLEPFSSNPKRVNFLDTKLIKNKIRAYVCAEKINNIIISELRKQFAKLDKQQMFDYVFTLYIKHFQFNTIIKMSSEDKASFAELMDITKSEKQQFTNLKSFNQQMFELFVRNSNKKTIANEARFVRFKNHFISAVNENKTEHLKYLLKDFLQYTDTSSQQIITDYFSKPSNNILEGSNGEMIKIMRDAGFNKDKLNQLSQLELKRNLYQNFQGFKRNQVLLRNKLTDKQDLQGVQMKTELLAEIEKTIDKLNADIERLEEQLEIRFDDETKRALSLKDLRMNNTYIENIVKDDNKTIIEFCIIDNTELSLTFELLFKRITYAHSLMTELKDNQTNLEFKFKYYSLDIKRAQVLKPRLEATNNKLKQYKQRFANISQHRIVAVKTHKQTFEYFAELKKKLSEKKEG